MKGLLIQIVLVYSVRVPFSAKLALRMSFLGSCGGEGGGDSSI